MCRRQGWGRQGDILRGKANVYQVKCQEWKNVYSSGAWLPFIESPLGRVISPCQTSVMAGGFGFST